MYDGLGRIVNMTALINHTRVVSKLYQRAWYSDGKIFLLELYSCPSSPAFFTRLARLPVKYHDNV
jgi:hypothetical protein